MFSCSSLAIKPVSCKYHSCWILGLLGEHHRRWLLGLGHSTCVETLVYIPVRASACAFLVLSLSAADLLVVES